MTTYDPFVRGAFPTGVRTVEAHDARRDRTFQIEIWYPAATHTPAPGSPELRDAAHRPGAFPLIVYSHPSGGSRRTATFLTTHLASHGYVVAAMDHSEVVAPELARREGETAEQKAARIEGWLANRVPDVRFLVDRMLVEAGASVDPTRIGIVGHSFGGWTALASVDVEPRLRSVVALAPGGSSRPKPGMLRSPLAFAWDRDVPTLLLAAEDDASLPIEGMYEIYDRTPATKQMVILRRADHLHFMDNVEALHEAVRTMAWPGELSWLPSAMRPIAELCSGDQAHLFARGLTVGHFDATLANDERARRFLAGDLDAELAARGIDAFEHQA